MKIASNNSEFLSLEQKNKRDFILKGNVWKVIWSICSPLALFQTISQLFKIIDIMIASRIGFIEVSAVAYISQISSVLTAIAGGIAVGGGIVISRNYGAGDYEKVKKQINGLFFISLFLGTALFLIIFPFSKNILRFTKAPPELIQAGNIFFLIEIFTLSLIFLNNTYISVEKALGNTKKIFLLNMGFISIKLFLTFLFVIIFKFGISMIATSTLIANLFLSISGVYYFNSPKNNFKLSFRSFKLEKEVFLPISKISFPIIAEKVLFSSGKVIVNSMATIYSSSAVGALGISNNISGLSTTPINGFQDGASSIISQNIGAKNYNRAIEIFSKLLTINLVIGGVGYLLTKFYINEIGTLFSNGNIAFLEQTKNIYSYERNSILLLALNSSVLSLLYGLGHTKISMLLNFFRLFIFRIPVLYFMINFTNFGEKSIGISMMLSNSLAGISAGIAAYVLIKDIKKNIK